MRRECVFTFPDKPRELQRSFRAPRNQVCDMGEPSLWTKRGEESGVKGRILQYSASHLTGQGGRGLLAMVTLTPRLDLSVLVSRSRSWTHCWEKETWAGLRPGLELAFSADANSETRKKPKKAVKQHAVRRVDEKDGEDSAWLCMASRVSKVIGTLEGATEPPLVAADLTRASLGLSAAGSGKLLMICR